MTDPTIGLWRDDKHRYYARYEDHPKAEGLPMPGVTSVIAKVDKSGPLIAWAKGVTADAALDNFDQIRVMLDQDGRAPTKAWLTAHATAESDRAKDLGTRVHLLAEQISRGASPDMDQFETPFVDAYQRFRRDCQPKFKSLEQFCWNPDLMVGGTFDWIAYLDIGYGPKLTLGDTKTGRSHYIESRIQLAALSRMAFIGRPNDTKRYPMPKIEQHVILHVRPELYERGYQVFDMGITEADFDAFRGALAIYRWEQARPSKGNPVAARMIEVVAA